MQRRELIKRSFTAIVTGYTAMLLPGCNVYSDIENWISVAMASVNSIVSILGANGFSPLPGIVQAVLGALSAVGAAITEYKSTVPAPVGAVAKIETALKDAIDQFGAFLRSLGLSGGLFTLIASLVQVILSTIAGFLTKLPVLPVTPAAQNRISTSLFIASQTMGLQVVPEHRTIRKFKKDYNKALNTAPVYGVTVPVSAYHKLTLFENL